MCKIKVERVSRGVLIYVPDDKLLELRENLINGPGLTTKPASERTPLEDVAIKLTAAADKFEKEAGSL